MGRKEEIQQFKLKSLKVLLHDSAGIYLYTARIVDIVGTRMLINRFSDTEVCCGGRRKRYREVVELDSIVKIEGNKIYIK